MEGRYANYFKVGHNAYEFVIEFGQCYGGAAERETIHSRIVTSPTYMKTFLGILKDAIGQFERTYGEIKPD